MGNNIIARAANGSEQLYRVFWLLWMPFSVLTMMVRKHTHGLDAGAGIVRSSAWPYYIGYVAFGIAVTWLLLAMWKCAPNVKLRIWF
jgi:hypothetical protein